MDEEINHSVVMMVYNQESYIKTALDSIFNQNPLPFEVIIGDDCSSDNTQMILYKYAESYPEIVRLFVNPINLGLINNFNNLLKYIKGDIVTFFAGDDILKPGLFLELNRVVQAEKINLSNDFVIVTNTSMLYPNGLETVWNNYKNKNCNAVKERIRYSLNYRSVGISASIISKVGPLIPELGYHSDWIWSLSVDLLSKNHYYTPFVSSVYRIGSGVASINSSDEHINSKKRALEYLIKYFFHDLDRSDLLYLSLEKAYLNYELSPSLFNYIRLFLLVLRNINNVSDNNYLVSIRTLVPKTVLKKIIHLKKYFLK